MKSDFALAITQLAAEKDLPKEVILSAVETALASAYRKEDVGNGQTIAVKISPASFEVKVFAQKTVVEEPSGPTEMGLAEAKKLRKDTKLGDIVNIELTLPKSAGRIAAQTAKQVIAQRLHEAEHDAIFEEFVGKEGDIVSGLVRRVEAGRVYVDLGRTEAVLPPAEQVKGERYRPGQRIKVYLMQIARPGKSTEITVSRTHRNLVRRLFELVVPEVRSGTVELKAIAREAGYRSKVAVAARQSGLDAVGTCVGQRGIRIQNILSELEGEKVDVIQWSDNPAEFIANALSPAQILNVSLGETDGVATVVVPDRQLSLAIGREGQNARLAAKLTGWRIDIKSASMVEAEQKEKAIVVEASEAAVVREAQAVAGSRVEETAAPVPTKVPSEPVVADTGTETGVTEGVLREAELVADGMEAPVAAESPLEPLPQIFIPVQAGETSKEIRFAEDIMPRRVKAAKTEKKEKKREAETTPRGKVAKKAKRPIEYQEAEEDVL